MTHPTITRGDLKPDLAITISDARESADFSDLTPADITVIGEMVGTVVFSRAPSAVDPAVDGKSAKVTMPLQAGDTDEAGRMWVRVVVKWPGGPEQTFPNGTPIFLDIRRDAGDA